MNKNKFGDREMLDDILSTEKFMTGCYNEVANECSSSSLKSEFVNILTHEHSIQHDIYKEMAERGWYNTTKAEQSKIEEAKTKYQNQQDFQ